MKLMIFSIFDEKSLCFSQPFYFPARGQATRAFADLVEDKQSTIARHPSDYKLYKLGEFDDSSGAFISLPQPEFLCNAAEFITEKG